MTIGVKPKAASRKPLGPDQCAAHFMLSELRTRIATQPLAYYEGVESKALESLWGLFGIAREAMKTYPGCAQFAAVTTKVLNNDLRPLTAKWDRAHQKGWLATQDGADEFRGELAAVQAKLVVFAETLHRIAYGTADSDVCTLNELGEAELATLFADLPFGIVGTGLVDASTAADIDAREGEEIARRRAAFEWEDEAPRPGMNAVGLALSGGGIRSATFCLGVVQELAQRKLLRDVDVLSTVSGGGYIGSFISTRLGLDDGKAADLGQSDGPDPDAVQYVRQHAQYLSVEHVEQRWNMVAAGLAGLLLNWTVPLFFVSLAAWAGMGLPTTWATTMTPVFFIASAAASVALIAYGIAMRWSPAGADLFGRTFAVVLIVLILTGLLAVHAPAEEAIARLAEFIKLKWAAIGLGGVLAAIPTVLRFVPVLKSPAVRTRVLKIALVGAAFMLPTLAFLLFHVLLGMKDWSVADTGPLSWITGPRLVLMAACLCGFVALFALDVNATGPHRLYRDGLARTFVSSRERPDPTVELTSLNATGRSPYHLLNAAVNLPWSETPALRDRKCDFFMFSKHYCGSPATGYQPTLNWRAGGKQVDLATAMAISGAAVAPSMGLESLPTLRAILTFLNVRLGYWMRLPADGKTSRAGAAGFSCLLREMTGVGMSEKKSWIYLSDGGHIENLGVYELLRRRCKFILCIDGEQDADYRFSGLMTVIRHAQIDFGVRIKPALDELRPDPATGFSRSHYAFCRVEYPPRDAGVEGDGHAADSAVEIGLLLYIKLSLTGNEGEMIRRYKTLHPEFPHQSTLDQFFDQEQFEMYRRLGVHIAQGLFTPAIIGDSKQPTTISQWYKALARSLLAPLKAKAG